MWKRANLAVSSDAQGRRDGGYVLFSVSLVLFVVAVVATFAVPSWQHSQRLTRAQATLADLKEFEAAFRAYAHDNADWPATALPGALPKGVEAQILSRWQKSTPLGGRYVWMTDTYQRGQRLRACIAIVSVTGNPVSDEEQQLTVLHEQAQLAGFPPNRLRFGFRHEPILVLEN